MCNNCYHTYGRDKKAWICGHVDKSHYALGFCQNCYHQKYSMIRDRRSISKVNKEKNLNFIENNK